MVTRCWCPKCGLFVPTGTSNVFKSNQPAAHGVASRIKSAYLRDVKRHHSAPRCFCWTCCKVNERHAHDKSISKCRLMRVASWLKCPDCKLQRNSEPLLKLNSCTKGGKKSPRFLGQVSIAPSFKSLPSNAASGSSPHFAVEFDQLISQRPSLMSPERQTFKSLPTIHRYLATLLDFQTAVTHAFTAPFSFFKKEQSFFRSNYWTPRGRLSHRGADI